MKNGQCLREFLDSVLVLEQISINFVINQVQAAFLKQITVAAESGNNFCINVHMARFRNSTLLAFGCLALLMFVTLGILHRGSVSTFNLNIPNWEAGYVMDDIQGKVGHAGHLFFSPPYLCYTPFHYLLPLNSRIPY